MRNARLLDQMRYQAEHDPLTGLANQRLLNVHAAQAIARARRDNTRVGLLFLDLDDFKDVNDTLGHAEGDRLLQLVTERLRSTLREGDTVARFGGDEFVVLLPSLTDDGGTVASKIALSLADRFVIGQHDVRISTSIGAAVFPEDGDDFGELLKQADIRMYRSKVARRAGQASRVKT
jgi:diguanylate cyclase (GGDEF)-like protein